MQSGTTTLQATQWQQRLLFCITGLLLSMVLISCSTAGSIDLLNRSLPAGAYSKQTLRYGTHHRQSLDIYLPKIAQHKTPIVFIYGGAWRGGEKRNYEFVAHALTGLGHPVIIPDYRLFPEVQFPTFINDMADSISFVERSSGLGLTKPFNHYILMGHSAGAHAAALLATDRRYLRARNVQARLTGLIAMAGPYDLPMNDPEVAPVFGRASAQQSKPILNVQANMPATLLLHGLNDTRVKPFHTERFRDAVQRSGGSVTTQLYPGVNHTRLIGSLAAPLRFLNSSYADIKQSLTRFD